MTRTLAIVLKPFSQQLLSNFSDEDAEIIFNYTKQMIQDIEEREKAIEKDKD
jgi:hypothetical protein